ncbi:MAG: hypothetical protein CMC08_00135 [Flavobacteriaceae bacterium]|nr:hypothetical protein [Flavobacteriaceae bacterium]
MKISDKSKLKIQSLIHRQKIAKSLLTNKLEINFPSIFKLFNGVLIFNCIGYEHTAKREPAAKATAKTAARKTAGQAEAGCF